MLRALILSFSVVLAAAAEPPPQVNRVPGGELKKDIQRKAKQRPNNASGADGGSARRSDTAGTGHARTDNFQEARVAAASFDAGASGRMADCTSATFADGGVRWRCPDGGVAAMPGPMSSANGAVAATLRPNTTADAGVATKSRPITIVVGGDVTLGFHYEEWFDEKVRDGGATRDQMFEYGFREVLPAVRKHDLFLVNLECPFTTSTEKIPKNFNFKARPELVNVLTAGGVDVVSLANNHLMDYGAKGLLETLDVLDAANIRYFGAGRTLMAAREPAIVERNGVKVAFLGYFFLGERNIEPPEVFAEPSKPGVAGKPKTSPVEEMEKMVREDVAIARTRADLVIPFFHWGREGTSVLEPYQQPLAYAAIDSGAHAVLGSHPHVLQGMELYKGAPIIYSLGNFVFGGNWNPRNKESAVIALTFDKRGFMSSKITPLHSDRYPERPCQPYIVKGQKAESVMRHLAEYSVGFPQMLPELRKWAPDAGR